MVKKPYWRGLDGNGEGCCGRSTAPASAITPAVRNAVRASMARV
jgi:hypothetical protein